MRQLKTKAMLCKAPLSNSSILWTMICIQYSARFLNHLRRLIKWEPNGFMKISLHRIFKFLDKCWSFVGWSLIDFVMMKNCYICPCILRWMYYGIWHWACLSVFLSVLLSISLPTSILEASRLSQAIYHLCQMIILGISRVDYGRKKTP